jgi:DNA-binding transcriptional ArsR family regulator
VGTSQTELSDVERLDLSDLDVKPVRMAHSLVPSVFSLLGESLGKLHNGAPDEWLRVVRSTLTRRDLIALLPVFGGERIFMPDCLGPVPAAGVASTRETLDEIAATDGSVLLEQAAVAFAENEDVPSPAWGIVEKRPERWLGEFARTMGRVAAALDDVWQAARPLLDRETERVGVAAMLGASREVLTSLHIGARAEGGDLVLRRWDGGWRSSIHEDGLVLVPMLGGVRSLVSWHSADAITHLAYPLTGQWRLLDDPARWGDGLDGLLGPKRAQILRLLDRPAIAGAVATALEATPSALTHHVAALESAGLVQRERKGQNVWIRRTARASALLALYGQGG